MLVLIGIAASTAVFGHTGLFVSILVSVSYTVVMGTYILLVAKSDIDFKFKDDSDILRLNTYNVQ